MALRNYFRFRKKSQRKQRFSPPEVRKHGYAQSTFEKGNIELSREGMSSIIIISKAGLYLLYGDVLQDSSNKYSSRGSSSVAAPSSSTGVTGAFELESYSRQS